MIQLTEFIRGLDQLELSVRGRVLDLIGFIDMDKDSIDNLLNCSDGNILVTLFGYDKVKDVRKEQLEDIRHFIKDNVQQILSLQPPTSTRSTAPAISASNNPDEVFPVFIGGLTPDITEHDLRGIFTPCGNIVSISIVAPKRSQPSKPFAFVNFADEQSQQTAARDCGTFRIREVMLTAQISVNRVTVSIGNIPYDISEAELLKELEAIGRERIDTLRIKHGVASVSYSKKSAADAAKQLLRGATVRGSRIDVDALASRAAPPRQSGSSSGKSCSLYVKNVSTSTDDIAFNEHFSRCSGVRKCVVKYDAHTKRHLGYGFVDFSDPECAEDALEMMRGTVLDGRTLHVELSKPKSRSYGAPSSRDNYSSRGYTDRGAYDRRGPPSSSYSSRYDPYMDYGNRYGPPSHDPYGHSPPPPQRSYDYQYPPAHPSSSGYDYPRDSYNQYPLPTPSAYDPAYPVPPSAPVGYNSSYAPPPSAIPTSTYPAAVSDNIIDPYAAAPYDPYYTSTYSPPSHSAPSDRRSGDRGASRYAKESSSSRSSRDDHGHHHPDSRYRGSSRYAPY